MTHRVRLGVVAAAAVVALTSCTSGPGLSASSPTVPASTTSPPPATAPPTIPPILIFGPRGLGRDAGAIASALEEFSERSGIAIDYVPIDDPNREFSRRVARDEPGDVFLIDSGELVQAAAVARTALVIPRIIDTSISDAWGVAWTKPGRLGDALFGAPVDAAIESLVWYQPARFAAAGYDVPDTWNELVALSDEIRRDDLVPFCQFSDNRTRSRAFVDWTFDLIIRSHDVAVYDQVLAEELPYADRKIFDDWTKVRDLWVTPGVGLDSAERGASEDSEASEDPEDLSDSTLDPLEQLLNGQCFMHRGGVEVIEGLDEATHFADGTPEALDVALFPGPRGNVPVVADVTYAVSRTDKSSVWAIVEYLGGSTFADDRRAAQGPGLAPGFQSSAAGQNQFQLDLLELSLLDVTSRATESRERWAEIAPAAVRIVLLETGEAVADGESRISDALDRIDEAG